MLCSGLPCGLSDGGVVRHACICAVSQGVGPCAARRVPQKQQKQQRQQQKQQYLPHSLPTACAACAGGAAVCAARGFGRCAGRVRARAAALRGPHAGSGLGRAVRSHTRPPGRRRPCLPSRRDMVCNLDAMFGMFRFATATVAVGAVAARPFLSAAVCTPITLSSRSSTLAPNTLSGITRPSLSGSRSRRHGCAWSGACSGMRGVFSGVGAGRSCGSQTQAGPSIA